MANEKVFLWINRDLLEFYALYVGILLLKCFVMIVHVGLSRVYYRAPRNPEDGSAFNAKVYKNENVERNRSYKVLNFFLIYCCILAIILVCLTMASEPAYLYGINRDLLRFYALYVGILLLKCFVMIVHVGLSRVYYKAPRNPEDGSPFNAKVYKNENVERNRRAHLNDLENIPFFIAVSFLYLLTDPAVEPTKWIIRVYVLSRIVYTLLYVLFKSIWRIPIFEIGLFTNFYLSFSVIYHFAGEF